MSIPSCNPREGNYNKKNWECINLIGVFQPSSKQVKGEEEEDDQEIEEIIENLELFGGLRKKSRFKRD